MRTRRTAIGSVLGLAMALAAVGPGCSSLDPLERPAAVTGEADFSSYVAIGTSVTMGFQSGGVVGDLQVHAYPAQLAAATGANGGTFVQPLVPSPGIPPVLQLVGFTIEGLPVLQPRPGTPPVAPSTPRPADGYDNLGISGAVLANALAKTSGDEPTNFFDLVLQGQGTMIRQALAQRPTFVTVELGLNDALRAVLAGTDAPLITAGEFQALYTQVMDSLVTGAPGARFALMNLLRVTDLPYATTIPLDRTLEISPGPPQTFRLRDAAGPLPDGSRILLPAFPLIAGGYGFPAPAPPLPDSLVLTVAERTAIDAAVVAYNAVIAQQAQARGAALVDAYGLFARLHTAGVVVGGTRYTTAWLRGGLISRDGIHPSSLGHGILANEFIRAINGRFGGSIPPVDLAPLADPARPLPDEPRALAVAP